MNLCDSCQHFSEIDKRCTQYDDDSPVGRPGGSGLLGCPRYLVRLPEVWDITSLPAISIRQPWAGLILLRATVPGLKDVENRGWALPRPFIGRPLLLHTGQQVDREVATKDTLIEDATWLAQQYGGYGPDIEAVSLNPDAFRMGGVLGMITISQCVQNQHLRSDWAVPGLWHWVIGQVRALPFCPCKGRLKIFQCSYPGAELGAGR